MSNNNLSLARSQPVTNTITLAAVVTAGVALAALFLPLNEAQTAGIITFATLAIPYVAAQRAKRLVTPNEYVAAEVINSRVITERDENGNPSSIEVKPVIVAGPALDVPDGINVEVNETGLNPLDETGDVPRVIPVEENDQDPGPYTPPDIDERGDERE